MIRSTLQRAVGAAQGAVATLDGLEPIALHQARISEEKRDALESLLRVGLYPGVKVTEAPVIPSQRVSQLF